jgi:hypothetical protein
VVLVAEDEDGGESVSEDARVDGVEGVQEDQLGDDPDPSLDGVPDGAGCTEIWEHLSEERTSASE